jgi:hypothetical protein
MTRAAPGRPQRCAISSDWSRQDCSRGWSVLGTRWPSRKRGRGYLRARSRASIVVAGVPFRVPFLPATSVIQTGQVRRRRPVSPWKPTS